MASPSKTFYTAVATSTGDGRNGGVRTSDGALQLDLASPGPQAPAGTTNPEQLFAAGYAACFHSALKGVARAAGTEVADSAVTAEVSIGQLPEGGYGLGVVLRVEVGGVDAAAARELAEAAHRACPYSNAVRGNVDVVLEVEAG